MRFTMLDRVVQLESGKSIQAIKQLLPEEDYLRDHFPRFPVMPGVLMLEAMFQASMWLVRESEDFQHSMVVLQQVRSVKYADFVEPGQSLTVTSEMRNQKGSLTTLAVKGTVGNSNAVSGRLILDRYNLADRFPGQATFDVFMRREMRIKFDGLRDVPAIEPVI